MPGAIPAKAGRTGGEPAPYGTDKRFRVLVNGRRSQPAYSAASVNGELWLIRKEKFFFRSSRVPSLTIGHR